MRKSWNTWLQEAIDALDVELHSMHLTVTKRFEDEAWKAFQAGQDAMDFAFEYYRDRRPEY